MQKIYKNISRHKVLIFSLAFLLIFSGTIKVFADLIPAPEGGYLPSSHVLDPGCTPGSDNCFIADTSGSLAIGSSIASSTPSQVLYTDNSGNLFSDANFTRDSNNQNTSIFANIANNETAGLQMGNNLLGLNFKGVGTFYYDTANSLNAFNVQGDGASLGQGGPLVINGVASADRSINASSLYNYNTTTHEAKIKINANTATTTRGILLNTTNGIVFDFGDMNKYIFPMTNSVGQLTNDGGGNLSWVNTTGFRLSGINNTDMSAGNWAGNSLTTGQMNFFAGMQSGQSTSTGNQNIAVGTTSLYSNTTGDFNIGIGFDALSGNSTGSYNTALGSNAGVLTDGINNSTAIGFMAFVNASNTIQLGNNNITNISSYGNLTLGNPGVSTITYPNNRGTIGQVLTTDGAGTASWQTPSSGVGGTGFTTDSNSNMYAGTDSGISLLGGSSNLFIGINAGESTTLGSSNMVNGVNALFSNTIGSYNVANGANALFSNITGNYNTSIGFNADVSSSNLFNATVIGANAIVTTSNTIQLGDTNITNINTSGTLTLGGITYPNTDGTIGQVLTTDGAGTADWQSIAGGTGFTNSNGNMFAGINAGYSLTTGSWNFFAGIDAGVDTDIGYHNTATGTSSLQSNTAGSNNTAYGSFALASNTTGISNTALGYLADVSIGNLHVATAIGAGAIVNASNSLVLGGAVGSGYEVNVGIGTTTPNDVLDIVGGVGDTAVLRISTTGGSVDTFNTTLGTFAITSDQRLKHDIVSIAGEDALTKLSALNPVVFHYNWQNSTDPLVAGFIAQEFETTFPELVSTDPVTGYKSLSYTPLIPYAISAIAELDLKITKMADEVDTGKVCLKKSDGTDVCLDGDKLDQILNSTSLLNSQISGTFTTIGQNLTDSNSNETATSTDETIIDPTQTINTDSTSTSTDQVAQ